MKLFNLKNKRPLNSGVIVDNLVSDWFAGVNSPIIYEERLKDGNWIPFAFDEEPQRNKLVDQMACVTHSIINAIEAEEFFITGIKVNYSKRWTAKLSGTTSEGNTLTKVAYNIAHFGLVLEEDYPTPAEYTFGEFYAPIPEPLNSQLIEKGKKWLEKWGLKYEFLTVNDPNLDYHLKQCPIQVVIPGHAICGVYSPDELMTYLDSYPPFIKKTPVSSLLQAMKPVLIPKIPFQSNDLLTEDIKFGMTGEPVRKLKHALRLCGWLPDEDPMTDFYGYAMADLVFNFQRANFPGIWNKLSAWRKPEFWEMVKDWPHWGWLVGPEWRRIINQIISRSKI